MTCPIPSNEAGRLQAVYAYDILDTLPEVEFDTLTRLAANALDMPAAVIGLMDSDRLWFKSQIGLGVAQLDRQIAFCAHALMQPNQVLMIEDMRLDQRFQHNPLVTAEPNIRFYAGAPLVNQQGYALGTIAVADTKPRTLTANQQAMLQDFSKLVVASLESRNTANLLQKFAMTDELTGLANRAQFQRSLQLELAHAERTGKSFSLFYMDLDNFKSINDTYGHAAGDEVLVKVAQRMNAQLRGEDLLARLGGDEFGLIVRNHVNLTAAAIAQRTVEEVSKPMVLSNGQCLNVGISIGYAGHNRGSQSSQDLLTQADEALYIDKRAKALKA